MANDFGKSGGERDGKRSIGDTLIDAIKKIFNPAFAGTGSADKPDTAKTEKIYAPVEGQVMPITQSADAAHQQETLGKGVCFMPRGGKVFAPVDGVIDMVFDTKHAVNIVSNRGAELLIHCGIDTVKLKGSGFTVHVAEGDKVTAGQLLLEYDKEIIERAGYSLETQMVVCNTDSFKRVTQAKTGETAVGDVVLYID